MARWDTIQVAGQPMRVYLDVPAGGGLAPGIVVIQHGPGVDRFIEDRVEDLARHGYVAATPDLYHRQLPDGADMATRMGRLRDSEILADVAATIAHLRQRRDPPMGDLAVLGFCMGGRVTYLLAGARPTVWRAAGVFYGGNIMRPWGDGPAPFDLTRAIACPVIGFVGQEDTNPSPADVDRIDGELTRHGKVHEFHRYDGAGHAFLNFTNAERYRPEPAKDAWAKMLGFLDRHLRGGDRWAATPSPVAAEPFGAQRDPRGLALPSPCDGGKAGGLDPRELGGRRTDLSRDHGSRAPPCAGPVPRRAPDGALRPPRVDW
jgi:carboxymethylenebutenolidase